jgi:hypothetical protein
MATTNTVTEPVPGVRLHSFTALAANDVATIPCYGAREILFQVTAGTFGDSTLTLAGSLAGSVWTGVYNANDLQTGVAAGAAGGITATATGAVLRVQACGNLRISLNGTSGTGIQCQVLVDTRVSNAS